jgi:hypothetical protein
MYLSKEREYNRMSLPQLQITPTIFIMILAIGMDFYAVLFKEKRLVYYSFRGMVLSILATISAFFVYKSTIQIICITIACLILSSLYISVLIKEINFTRKLSFN